MRLPPVRCASAGAERREGGLCADPAYVVILQAKKEDPTLGRGLREAGPWFGGGGAALLGL
jgi:hypothetical protein